MGMKNLSPNDQGTISHMFELTIEKIYINLIITILYFFGINTMHAQKLIENMQSKLDKKTKIEHKLGTLMFNML
jgi:hypothetical protein